MDIALDKSALFAAMEAFWQTDTGNDKGVEAAIAAYIERMGLAPFNEMAARKRAALAAATARQPEAARR
ncbi:hypothetical protein [Ensifer sp. LC163]|uniref:hypothetical protein n=1 Tax=Ensifer sp. LC163 TaxID=1120652 RepID=UPI000812EA6B|nr:hypothetical protein [Ensifer sp. LC163]OCP38655.1 hypothetical protein BC360_00875 [Ensifer sp. LC163]